MPSVRQSIYEVLGHLSHARIELDKLKRDVVEEMQQGFRPTHRGREWTKTEFQALEEASEALERTWDLCKYIQFPEMKSRLHS